MLVHNDNKLPTKPIADLLATQGDLKDLTDTNYKKLKNTIEKRGFSVPVYVWQDDTGILHLLDGHQRQRVLVTEGWNEPIPYLRVPAKDLQEAMARLLEITSQYGTVTQEGIDAFIAKYDLPEAEIYEATHFDAILQYENIEDEEDENPYTGKIETPIYNITGDQPEVNELYDTEKTKALITEIKSSSLSEHVKEFLVYAANRHTVFNYANIAEFYAHADGPTQELMEKSALVIIDYDKAIELGYVKMSKEIAETFEDEEA